VRLRLWLGTRGLSLCSGCYNSRFDCAMNTPKTISAVHCLVWMLGGVVTKIYCVYHQTASVALSSWTNFKGIMFAKKLNDLLRFSQIGYF
jgi:hypothetical protein